MLERLLESRSKPERSVGGTIASVTGHTVLVAAALYATGQAHDNVLLAGALRPAQRRCRSRFLHTGSACLNTEYGSDDSIHPDRWPATNFCKCEDS